jgi:WD40 repeat protein
MEKPQFTTPTSFNYVKNTYCPHIYNHFYNSYLTNQFEIIKIKNELVSNKEPKYYNFRNLILFSSPKNTYKHFTYMQAINLFDNYLINNLSLEWIVLNNQQNLSYSSINRDGCIFTINFNDFGTEMATGNNNHNIEIWDLKNKVLKYTLTEHNEIVTGIEYFHRSNDYFLSCSLDKTIKLWKNYKSFHTFIEHNDWIRCLSISYDNKYFISGCVSSVIKLWDLNSNIVLNAIKNLNKKPNSLSTVNSLEFMKNNNNIFLAGLRNGEVKIFDRRIKGNNENESIGISQEFYAHNSKLNSVKFNESENYLLSSGRDSILRLWDMRNLPNSTDEPKEIEKKIINEYKGHRCIGYNIDSNFFIKEKYIITGSEDFNIYIYDTVSAKLKKKIPVHQKCINLIKPIPNSYGFAFTGLEDVSIFIWNPIKNTSRIIDKKYSEKYNEKLESNYYDDDLGLDLIDEKENEQQQMGVKMVEEIMSECGDMILKIFHNHNLTYSNGINFENLLEIIQKSNDQESLKVLNMINEKFMKKLMDNFINGMKPKTEKKEIKKENKYVESNEIKCNSCLSKKTEKIEVTPSSNDFDLSLLNFPNTLGFNENIEKEKKKKIAKEQKFKFNHEAHLVDNAILLNKII